MKTTQLSFLALLGIVSFAANAQTVTLTSATPATTTFGGSNSVHVGVLAGNGTSSTGGNNTFVGNEAGKSNTTGSLNTFIGQGAGLSNKEGEWNVFLGQYAGFANVSGKSNIFTGIHAGESNNGNGNIFTGSFTGRYNTSGSANIFIGDNAGSNNSLGSSNVAIGINSGLNIAGNYNTMLGYQAGFTTTGAANVFLGAAAGYYEAGSNKLYIDNSATASPLIWGDFHENQLKFNGKVGIGGDSTTGFGNFPTVAGGVILSNYKLFVYGGILTEEVRVNLRDTNGQWADYVFNKDYNLKPLSEVETFIKVNGHLPNVPSAAQVKEEGIELGNMAKIQQEKIEELTLYVIEQNKINEKQGKEIDELKAQIKMLLDKK